MVEDWAIAFGLYLRTLRERRGLSLLDVSSLSQAFAETLNKGYLSRCENGKQRLAFAKLIPLSRIYDVESDVLLQRLELDMELQRVGPPSTDGMSFAELTKAGSDAINGGHTWAGYAYLRDAVQRARVDPVESRYRDQAEQWACAEMSCGTAAFTLSRYRFALHEFLYVESSGRIGPRISSVLLERLSQAYRALDNSELARSYADKAVRCAEENEDDTYLGYVYSNRASQAIRDADSDTAIEYLQKAHSAHQTQDRVHECARCLNNLAQVYFDGSRLGAARRALIAADHTMRGIEQHRTKALGRVLMGEIELRSNRPEQAEKLWKEASDMARKLNDKLLRFKSDFLLLKLSIARGQDSAARAIRRRLDRLAHWIPENTPELVEFKDLPPGNRRSA